MINLKNKTWKGPEDWTFINKLTWGEPETELLIKVLESDWFGGNSEFNVRFEDAIKRFSGLKFFQSANSGSASIELGVQALIQSGRWKRGDKIIHPSLTFPTSISSAIMAGLVPVFVDVEPGTYVIDANKVADILASDPSIQGAIIPALLGNVPDLDIILKALAGRPLIIDSCDVMGSTWREKEVASLATVAAYSFYGSHHISTFGVGGGVGTNDDELFKLIKSMTFWGRDNTIYTDKVRNFLSRYTYDTLGMDAQMSAIQAAFGIAQLDKLPDYIGQRQLIFTKLQRLFVSRQEWFVLPQRTSDKADVSWFCYPIVVRENAPFSRNDFAGYMLDNKVEIRPIFCNILDQKMLHTDYKARVDYLVHGEIKNTIEATTRGFFIPACPMGAEQQEHYLNLIKKFIEKY